MSASPSPLAGISGAETSIFGSASSAVSGAAKVAGATVLGTILAGPMGGVVASSVSASELGVRAALGLGGDQQQDPGWSWSTIAVVALFAVLGVWLIAKVLHEGAGVAKSIVPKVI